MENIKELEKKYNIKIDFYNTGITIEDKESKNFFENISLKNAINIYISSLTKQGGTNE